jgi:hypothetical protein
MRTAILCVSFLFGLIICKDCRSNIYYSTRLVNVISEDNGYEETIDVEGQTSNLDENVLLTYDKLLQQITDIKVIYTDNRGRRKTLRPEAVFQTMLNTKSFFSAHAAFGFTIPANVSYHYTYKRQSKELMLRSTIFEDNQYTSDSAYVKLVLPAGLKLFREKVTSDSIQIDSIIDDVQSYLIFKTKYPLTDYSSGIRVIVVPTQTTNNWEYFNDWFLKKSILNSVITPTLAEETINLTQGVSNRDSIIHILFNFVRKRIKYIAVEDGLGAFIPRKPDSVLAKKEGDCKDMANLLCCMLKIKKIDAYLAITATKGYYSDMDFPSLSSGNHAICVISNDSSFTFLDPTHPCMSIGVQPEYLEGRNAFLMGYSESGKLVLIPQTTEIQNRVRICQKMIENVNYYSATIQFEFVGNTAERFMCNQYFHSEHAFMDEVSSFLVSSIHVVNSNNIKTTFTDSSFSFCAEANFAKDLIDSVGNTIILNFAKLIPVFNTINFILNGDMLYSMGINMETEIQQINPIRLKPLIVQKSGEGHQSTLTMTALNNIVKIDQRIIIRKNELDKNIKTATLFNQINKSIQNEFSKP